MLTSPREPTDPTKRQGPGLDEYRFSDHDPRIYASADEPTVRPNPRPRRRRSFTAHYKLQILREADACRAPGEIAALLRREGLWPSHLAAWRTARDKGALAALSPRMIEPGSDEVDERRIAELERENARLRARLDAAEQWLERQRSENRSMVQQASNRGDQRAVVQLVQSTAEVIGVREACRVLGVSRASYYRWQSALEAEFREPARGAEVRAQSDAHELPRSPSPASDSGVDDK